jgi:hypothetical protein
MTLKQAAQTVLRGWLITTESALAEGNRVELEVSWPAQQLAGVPAADGDPWPRGPHQRYAQAAIIVQKYEFKTRGCAKMLGPSHP